VERLNAATPVPPIDNQMLAHWSARAGVTPTASTVVLSMIE